MLIVKCKIQCECKNVRNVRRQQGAITIQTPARPELKTVGETNVYEARNITLEERYVKSSSSIVILTPQTALSPFSILCLSKSHSHSPGTLPPRSASPSSFLLQTTSQMFMRQGALPSEETLQQILIVVILEEGRKIPRVFKIKSNCINLFQPKQHKFTFWLPNDIHMSKPAMTQCNKH